MVIASQRAEPRQRPAEHRPRAILSILSLASFMASLDLFIVNVALDKIGDSFRGASIGDVSWVLNAYAIVYAALLVPLGRLADKVGSRTPSSGRRLDRGYRRRSGCA